MARVRGFAVATLLSVAALAIAGCGGDSSDDSDEKVAAATAAAPPARGIKPESLAEAMGVWMAESKARDDCAELDGLSVRSSYFFKCPLAAKARASMRHFKVVDANVLGSGAMVSYKTRDQPEGVILMFVAPDGGWAISRMGLLYDTDMHSSDDDSREGFDNAVNGYLRAVRDRSCARYMEYSVPIAIGKRRNCKRELGATKPLTEALSANNKLEPQYLGGNEDFGFYNVQARKPKPLYLTVSVVKTTEGAEQPYLVLNADPGPTPVRQPKPPS